jgi:predicted GNAT superfamily acetyltransferase
VASTLPRPPWTIRPLTTADDYDACVALQRLTWGDDFRELVPPALLQISQKLGGIAAGAFLDDRLVGFVFGMTGIREGTVVHWSHMLAVATDVRDQGMGRALKTYQREQAVTAGIRQMYWTFDPLVARNAHMNLHRLGARVTEYVRDMYGENPMSRTDSVIGSDRFVVRWELNDGTSGAPGRQPAEGSTGRRDGPAEIPTITSAEQPLPDAPVTLVRIPADIQRLKHQDPERALAWRAATRRAFEHYLSRGYEVVDFLRDAVAYRLERKP